MTAACLIVMALLFAAPFVHAAWRVRQARQRRVRQEARKEYPEYVEED